MDPIGTIIFIGSIVSLLLALQLGGQAYAWNSGRVIALLVLFGVIFIAWVSWQIYLGPMATIPKSVISQRSVAFASWYAFAQGGVNFGILYYAPLWFQGVRGEDAVKSGLDIVTFIAGMTVVLIALGYYLTKGGYSAPFMIACVVVTAIATGLLTTWTPHASDAHVFGYLTLYGVGQGLGWQQPTLIAQTMLAAPDIPTGTALANICKLLGGTISVSIAQTLFNNKLKELVMERIPSLDPNVLVTIGALDLRSKLDPSLVPSVVACYNDAIKDVWWMLLAFCVASLPGALGVEWRSVLDKVANQALPPPPQETELSSQPSTKPSNETLKGRLSGDTKVVDQEREDVEAQRTDV